MQVLLRRISLASMRGCRGIRMEDHDVEVKTTEYHDIEAVCFC